MRRTPQQERDAYFIRVAQDKLTRALELWRDDATGELWCFELHDACDRLRMCGYPVNGGPAKLFTRKELAAHFTLIARQPLPRRWT